MWSESFLMTPPDEAAVCTPASRAVRPSQRRPGRPRSLHPRGTDHEAVMGRFRSRSSLTFCREGRGLSARSAPQLITALRRIGADASAKGEGEGASFPRALTRARRPACRRALIPLSAQRKQVDICALGCFSPPKISFCSSHTTRLRSTSTTQLAVRKRALRCALSSFALHAISLGPPPWPIGVRKPPYAIDLGPAICPQRSYRPLLSLSPGSLSLFSPPSLTPDEHTLRHPRPDGCGLPGRDKARVPQAGPYHSSPLPLPFPPPPRS